MVKLDVEWTDHPQDKSLDVIRWVTSRGQCLLISRVISVVYVDIQVRHIRHLHGCVLRKESQRKRHGERESRELR